MQYVILFTQANDAEINSSFFFFVMESSLLYGYTTAYFSIYLSTAFWVVSSVNIIFKHT